MGAIGCRILGLDLIQQVLAVLIRVPQAGVGPCPLGFIVRIFAYRQLPDHHEVGLINHIAIQDLFGVGLLAVAGLALGIVAGRGNHVQQSLGAFTEGVQADIVDVGCQVGVVFIHHEVAGGAGVLVLGILGQCPHVTAPGAMHHGV